MRAFRYIPVLMAQAKIIWSEEEYEQVEKLFRRSAEFCGENDIWRLNLAHTLFMQVCKDITSLSHHALLLCFLISEQCKCFSGEVQG